MPEMGVLNRFGRGLRDPIDGSAQMLTQMLPQGLVQGGNDLNNWLAKNTGLVGALPPGGVDQQVREGEAAYQQARGTNELDIPRLLGNIASPATLGLAAKVPYGAGALSQLGYGALGGGVAAAMHPVTTGEFAPQKLDQIGIGSGLGAVVQPIVGALSRVFGPQKSAAMEAASAQLFAPAVK